MKRAGDRHTGFVDDDVIAALEAGLASNPSSVAIRRLLTETLMSLGRWTEAAGHIAAMLNREPDSTELRELAARCAEGQVEDTPAPRDRASRPTSEEPLFASDLVNMWATGELAPEEPEIGELLAPTVTLGQVGGLAEVKSRLERSLFAPIRHPELAASFGAAGRGGIVLYGPPGCGKTFLARAVAGELGARFYSIGITDVLDMWVGSSERNVANMFEVARRHRPCVLFLDEIDALGMRRTQLRNSPAMRTAVNQLLVELDGVGSDNDGVFILAATNHPWDIDPALLRPGRLGQLIFVPPPDYEARAHIAWSVLRDRPHADLDVWSLAAATDGYSGADLQEVVERASEVALEQSLRSGQTVPITTSLLMEQLGAVRPSIGSWIATARNVANHANESGNYDDLLEFVSRRRRR